MVLLIARSRLASPQTYHPTLNEDVSAARAADVPVIIFPALLRMDLIEPTAEQFFRDIARARHKSCQSCIDANVKCVLHNGSSYRCLRCWVKQLPGCSHEAYMVERGYRNPPICKPYSDAAKENLTPVPDNLVWGGIGRQASDIADVPKEVDEEEDDESVTVMLSEKEEQEDEEDEEDGEDEEDEDEDEDDEDDEEGASHDLGRKGKGKKPSNTSGVSRTKRKTQRSNIERLLEGIAKDVKTIVELLKDKSAATKDTVNVKEEGLDCLPQSIDAYDPARVHAEQRALEEQQAPIAGPSRTSGGEQTA